MPVSQCDLTPRWRGVEHLDASALYQIDAVLRAALFEQLRSAIEHLALARGRDRCDLGVGQALKQRRRSALRQFRIGRQQRADALIAGAPWRGRRGPLGRGRLRHRDSVLRSADFTQSTNQSNSGSLVRTISPTRARGLNNRNEPAARTVNIIAPVTGIAKQLASINHHAADRLSGM